MPRGLADLLLDAVDKRKTKAAGSRLWSALDSAHISPAKAPTADSA